MSDGSNPPFRLCHYCQQALAGKVTIIDTPLPEKQSVPATRSNPRSTKAFWRKRKEVKSR